MTSISIIVCTLNRPNLISKYQLEHLKLLNPEDELIIVDASSNDQTEQLIKAYNISHSTSRIKYVRALPGLPAQRNIGVQNSEKDIILFLDDDISLACDAIASLKNYFSKNHNVDGLTGRLVEKNSPNAIHKILTNILSKFFGISCFGFSKLLSSGLPVIPDGNLADHKAEFMRGGFSAYKRIVFNNDCKFNENLSGYAYLEDTDFSHKLKRNGRSLVYSSCLTGFHEHISATKRNHTHDRCQYVLNYLGIVRDFNIKRINCIRALVGLLLLNLIKTLISRNSSYIKGTTIGCSKFLSI
jgi:glycosyltransferase involved in cell wall biosynthesis